MARRRHTPEQIVRKLHEADRLLGEGAEVDVRVVEMLQQRLGLSQRRACQIVGQPRIPRLLHGSTTRTTPRRPAARGPTGASPSRPCDWLRLRR